MRRAGRGSARLSLLATGLWLLAALAAATTARAAEIWRIQTALPAVHPVHVATERWAADVGRMTGGRLRVEVLPGGAVVPPTELIDAAG